MAVPYRALNSTHPESKGCKEGQERKARRAEAAATRAAHEVTLKSHSDDLGSVDVFKYLGRLMSPAVTGNIRKALAKWARLSRALGREGVDARLAGKFYVAVVQAVLLFGAETWVVTPRILAALEGFHHRVARRITDLVGRRGRDGTWLYPEIATALERAGLFPIQVYITRRQNTIAKYVATRPIGSIARDEKPPPGDHRLRWWDQEGLVFEEMEAEIDLEEQGGQ